MSSCHAEDANNAELPSIEELTRHMQDLTDADKSDADIIIESAGTAKETIESSAAAVEGSEVAGAEQAETAHETVTGNVEDAPIDSIQVSTRTRLHTHLHNHIKYPTIQNLQEEIDKLLAPLCAEGETSERREISPSVEAEVIVERAIVETDVVSDSSAAATLNAGKRERPPSAASSGGENQAGSLQGWSKKSALLLA